MEEKIKKVVKDILTVSINLLAELIDKPIEPESIKVTEGPLQSVIVDLPENLYVIPIKFTGEISGDCAFVIPDALGARIVAYLMGAEPSESGEKMDESAVANLVDAFSQLGVVAASALSSNLNVSVLSEIGQLQNGSLSLASIFEEEIAVRAVARVKLDGNAVTFDYFMSKSLADKLGSTSNEAENVPEATQVDKKIDKNDKDNALTLDTDSIDDELSSRAEIDTPSFPLLTKDAPTQGSSSNIDLLLDVPLDVSVELGRTKMQIKDLLELSEGSIIELDKLAGQPVDFLVNGRLISRGEVVVIDENFGIRITEIISPLERINSL